MDETVHALQEYSSKLTMENEARENLMTILSAFQAEQGQLLAQVNQRIEVTCIVGFERLHRAYSPTFLPIEN